MNDTDPVYTLAKNTLLHMIDSTASAASMLTLVSVLVPMIERTARDKSGVYKRELCVNVLCTLLKERGVPPSVVNEVRVLAPTVITLLIDVAVGNIDLGKTAKRCLFFCTKK